MQIAYLASLLVGQAAIEARACLWAALLQIGHTFGASFTDPHTVITVVSGKMTSR